MAEEQVESATTAGNGAIPPVALVRMVALVRDLAKVAANPYGVEARAIERLFDPDKAIVDEVIADLFPEAADPNEWAIRKVAMECLRRARLSPSSQNDRRGCGV